MGNRTKFSAPSLWNFQMVRLSQSIQKCKLPCVRKNVVAHLHKVSNILNNYQRVCGRFETLWTSSGLGSSLAVKGGSLCTLPVQSYQSFVRFWHHGRCSKLSRLISFYKILQEAKTHLPTFLKWPISRLKPKNILFDVLSMKQYESPFSRCAHSTASKTFSPINCA